MDGGERRGGLRTFLLGGLVGAASGALASFMTKADEVPGLTAAAEERVHGAYGGARARVKQVAGDSLKELEAKGLPARAVHRMMTELSGKHAKTSRNFWN